ncbi:MAG: adenine phosphoribosyltransferase [Micromonosporaceae bacterium]|nr:adenine phosphoribosyltransferase [Micromonosporaceae bacterium]
MVAAGEAGAPAPRGDGDVEAGPPRGDGGTDAARLVADHVVDVPDFPLPGIVFKDLTPLFADGPAFAAVVDEIVTRYGSGGFDVVAGIEARGFMLAAAVAYASGVGVVGVRKAGKLPRATFRETYALEYGEATLEVHTEAFLPGQRVLVVDDVLATGGTAAATINLVARTGGVVCGFTVLLELSFLSGRERLKPRPVHALLTV